VALCPLGYEPLKASLYKRDASLYPPPEEEGKPLAPLEKMRSEGSKFAFGKLMGRFFE